MRLLDSSLLFLNHQITPHIRFMGQFKSAAFAMAVYGISEYNERQYYIFINYEAGRL